MLLLLGALRGGDIGLLEAALKAAHVSFSEGVGDDDEPHTPELNLRQCRKKISDGHFTAAMRVLSSSGIAPYSLSTLTALRDKHPAAPLPALPCGFAPQQSIIAFPPIVLDSIRSFPRGTSCGRDGLRA